MATSGADASPSGGVPSWEMSPDAASNNADASAAGGGDAMACFSLFHTCAKDVDCCAPNRCLNITGTLACGQEGPAVGGSTGSGGTGGSGGVISSATGTGGTDAAVGAGGANSMGAGGTGPSGTGGVSSTGVSQATLLAEGQTNPNAIAIDQNNIYWFNLGVYESLGGKASGSYTGGQLMKCSKSGCGQTPAVLASNRVQSLGELGPLGGGPMGLVTDGVNVYWKDMTSSTQAPDGGLVQCSIDGCNDNPSPIGSGGATFPVSGTNIYLTDSSMALLNTCPASGCGSALTALWSAEDVPMTTGIAVDLSGVYWATAPFAQIMKCPVSGCNNAPTVIMTGTGDWNATNIYNLAVDDNFVYASNTNANGLILKCAKTGCGSQPVVLASAATAASAIATDGVDVYWIQQLMVRRCAVGGCNSTPTTIWSGVTTLTAIALDDNNVYWTDTGSSSGDGRIWMAPK